MGNIINLSKMFLVIVLTLSSLNCHRKDEDDYITGPNSGISVQFRNLVSAKTFNVPAYITADEKFNVQFSDYTIVDSDNKEITFDSKGLPSKFFTIDQKTNNNTVKTIRLHSTPSSTRGIYYVKATGVKIDVYDTTGDVEMYVGIEIAANGNLLYETDPVIQWKLSDEQSIISAQNVDWNTSKLTAVKYALDDTTYTEAFKNKLPIWFEGGWVSINTYTNIDSSGIRFSEYGLLKISNNNAGDIVFTYYEDYDDSDGGYFNPSREDAIDYIYNTTTFYWDFLDTSDKKYTTMTNNSYLFKINENRYVNITAYQNFVDNTQYKLRVYDLEKISENTLKVHNAKYYGNMYKDLIFEKVSPPITTP